MKKIILVFTLITACIINTAFAQDNNKRNVHLGFVYPFSTNGKDAAKFTNKFSLHTIAGVSKNETGVIISGLCSVIKDSAKGFQLADFSNSIGKSAHGVQVAGFINVSGGGNPVQFAGFANVTRQDTAALQVAGFVNKAATVKNQIGGFLNIAKKVQGVQLSSFINIADSSDYPIGILNFIKNGKKQLSISIDESANTLLTFRSGSRKMYGIIGLGYNLKSPKNLFIAEAGLGYNLKITQTFRISLEATTLNMANFKKGSGDYFKYSFSALPTFKVGQRFEIFAGPRVSYVNYTKSIGDNITNHYLWTNSRPNNFNGIYIGGMAGLSIVF